MLWKKCAQDFIEVDFLFLVAETKRSKRFSKFTSYTDGQTVVGQFFLAMFTHLHTHTYNTITFSNSKWWDRKTTTLSETGTHTYMNYKRALLCSRVQERKQKKEEWKGEAVTQQQPRFWSAEEHIKYKQLDVGVGLVKTQKRKKFIKK